MNLIKPKNLKKGDTIAIIAPCGNIEEQIILNGVNYFKKEGFNVVLGQNILKKDRYMAGSDKQRLQDIEWAFSNKNIDAIICARGGYGALRLIKNIDYNIIRNNPKIFCGYSDVTILSLMILKNTGLITFSSPMIKGDFQPDDIDEFTQKHFMECMVGNFSNITSDNIFEYHAGKSKGILWGGNLSSVCSLCGIDFIPDSKFIFFTEDLNEPVYKIDRYFRQLLNIDKFHKNITGIILGEFMNTQYPEQLDILFKEISNELNIPICSGYKISHGKSKLTIPIGTEVTLDNGIIKFL